MKCQLSCISKYRYEFQELLDYDSSSIISLCKSPKCQQIVIKCIKKEKMMIDKYIILVFLIILILISFYNSFENEDSIFFCNDVMYKQYNLPKKLIFIRYICLLCKIDARSSCLLPHKSNNSPKY